MFGVWCLVFGVWCLVFGVWCLVLGVVYDFEFVGNSRFVLLIAIGGMRAFIANGFQICVE